MFLFIKKHIFSNKYLYLIIILYFVLRIFNLTAFPLFNDESIYLDWGLREVNHPGFLFYSLYDAKQPLLMWAFGIMENLLPNPIFAGRLVSVFAGFLTMLGIYKLTDYISNKKAALLASFFYILIPLFSFYDRQALMEAAVSAVGIWSCYFLIKILKENKYVDFISIGVVLGIGYFIKSTPLVFLFSSSLLIVLYASFVRKIRNIIEGITITIISFLAVIFLLILNPSFWQTLSTNSRFTLSFSELLSFPFGLWINNIVANLRISFFYLTPAVLLLGIIGIVLLIKQKDKLKLFTVLFFLISLTIETLIIRSSIDRYVVAFLTLIPVFASLFLISLINSNKARRYGIMLIIFVIMTSFPITLFQIMNQAGYFLNYGRISGINYYNYLDSYTTGYGLDKVYAYFDEISRSKRIVVGVAENTGNPESAMIVNYSKNPNVQVVYFDSRLLSPEVLSYDCLDTGIPTYFVSRENQLVGLDKYFVNVKFVRDPYGKNITGIYELKTNCKGKKAFLNLKEN